MGVIVTLNQLDRFENMYYITSNYHCMIAMDAETISHKIKTICNTVQRTSWIFAVYVFLLQTFP